MLVPEQTLADLSKASPLCRRRHPAGPMLLLESLVLLDDGLGRLEGYVEGFRDVDGVSCEVVQAPVVGVRLAALLLLLDFADLGPHRPDGIVLQVRELLEEPNVDPEGVMVRFVVRAVEHPLGDELAQLVLLVGLENEEDGLVRRGDPSGKCVKLVPGMLVSRMQLLDEVPGPGI